MKQTVLRALATVSLLALVLWFVNPALVIQRLVKTDPQWLIFGFAAATMAALLSALRWHALAAWMGLRSPRRDLLIAYWRGIAANTVLPGGHLGGDALRALHLQRAGHPLGSAAISVVLDRISGLWVLIAISLATTAIAQFAKLFPADLLPMPAAATALIAIAALVAPLLAWRLSTAITTHLPKKLAGLLAVMHQRPAPLRQYIAQLFWSGGVQAFSIAAFACGARAVGLDLPWWLYFIVAGPVFILAALPVSIGGWGTREAAAAISFGLFGAPRELAVAAAILYGLFAVLQGLLGALTLLHSGARNPD